MFKGSFVALITPFKDGAVDETAFRSFVQWQIEQGTNGLVPCGTTGESPSLSHGEHRRLIEICVEISGGKVPVLAGSGANSTAHTIHLTRQAKEAGADAALVVTPYYNKPTQEGLYQHYKAITEAVDLPVVIYNIPGRSIVDMSVDTMARLAELPNIVGVKDATADLSRPQKERLAMGPEFCQMSGEDGTAVPYLAAGGHGCISVTGNIAPKLCSEMHAAWWSGDLARVMEIQDHLMPVHSAMFSETSPGPVKYAASLLGLCAAEMRLPMWKIAGSSETAVRDALVGADLLK